MRTTQQTLEGIYLEYHICQLTDDADATLWKCSARKYEKKLRWESFKKTVQSLLTFNSKDSIKYNLF